MQEKEMVNDMLSTVNNSIGEYGSIIAQCDNPQLRQMFQTLRDGDETFQYNLYKMAAQKGYYKPAAPASPQDIQQVKSQMSQG